MILRKPYKFLIKNFKLIHFLLMIVYSYLAYRTYRVYDFISEYQAQGWSKGIFFDAKDYIGASFYIMIYLSLIIVAIIVLLMRKKDKPVKVYYSTIAIYLFGLIFITLTYDTLKDLAVNINFDIRVINIYKDINLTFFIVQLAIVFLFLKRALGFDFKKFDFGQDIEELKVDMSDSEEVEIQVEIDTDNAMADLRKTKREAKFFYLENKFILNILFIALIFVVSVAAYLNVNVYNRIYNERETVPLIGHSLTVLDSYKTKKNYNNQTITKEDQSYLVIKVAFKNTTSVTKKISNRKFNLLSNGLIYGITKTNSLSFLDLGSEIKEEEIAPGETKEFLLVYNLNDVVFDNDLYLRYTDSLKFYVTKIEAKYKKIKLSIEDIDSVKTQITSSKIKETLNFSDSILKETEFTINDYEIAEKFYYNYESCIRNDCRTYQDIIRSDINSSSYKALLSLNVDLNLFEDLNLKYIDSEYNFIRYMSKIIYFKDDKKIENVFTLKDRTPTNYKGDNIYVEVPYDLMKAEKIMLNFNIRNKVYNYIIKEN